MSLVLLFRSDCESCETLCSPTFNLLDCVQDVILYKEKKALKVKDRHLGMRVTAQLEINGFHCSVLHQARLQKKKDL